MGTLPETQWLEDDFAPFRDPLPIWGSSLLLVSEGYLYIDLTESRLRFWYTACETTTLHPLGWGLPKDQTPIFRCYAAMLVSGRSNDFDTISPISELQLFLPSSWLILLRMTPFVKGKLDPLGVFPPSVWREKSYDGCANNRWISESVNCPIPPSNWHESGYQKEDQAFQVLCCSSWGGSIPFLLRSWHCLMIILKKSKHLC